ncbi:DUF58 domain-containing protein [Massilibacterium senegalense]|uniref:DUF58 domain-containing protein n=1 Tax=Massilibacterium senegalense TaxID=1632858 RepID=UPI000784EB14|nr:DUF58 domain-containing protein [Massilibacterium senegalense]
MSRGKRVQLLFLLGLLFIGTFSYAMIAGGKASWFIFYSFLPLEVYILLIIVYPFQKVKTHHHFSTTITVPEQSFEVTLELTMPIYFPFFYIIVTDRYTSHVLRRPVKHRFIGYPWLGQTIRITYMVEMSKRGEYTFDEVEMLVSDPFGWLRRTIPLKTTEVVTVYPKLQPLHHWGEQQIRSNRSKGRASMEKDRYSIVGNREYVLGDRLNRIDFKASARTGEWKTKEFDNRGSQVLTVVLDQRIANGEEFEEILSFFFSIVATLSKMNQVQMLLNGKWMTETGASFSPVFLHELAKAQSISSPAWISSLEKYPLAQKNSMLVVTHQLFPADLAWVKKQAQTTVLFVYFVGKTEAELELMWKKELALLRIPYVCVPTGKEEAK